MVTEVGYRNSRSRAPADSIAAYVRARSMEDDTTLGPSSFLWEACRLSEAQPTTPTSTGGRGRPDDFHEYSGQRYDDDRFRTQVQSGRGESLPRSQEDASVRTALFQSIEALPQPDRHGAVCIISNWLGMPSSVDTPQLARRLQQQPHTAELLTTMRDLTDLTNPEHAHTPMGGCSQELPPSLQADSQESPCPHEPTLMDCFQKPSSLMVVSQEPSTLGSQEPQSTFPGRSDQESQDSPPDAQASNTVAKVADQ